MDSFNNIILGVIQGLTEFLPVSSSGHLVLGGHLLGVQEAGIVLEVLLHFGTLMATLLVFRKPVWNILSGLFQRKQESTYQAFLIVLASIPTGLMGILLKDKFETLFDNLTAVGVALLVTGTLLWTTRFFKNNDKDITWKTALLIGIIQGFAITPGISRSGSTICLALILGIRRKQAGEFSFLISLPAILGATLLHIKDAIELNNWALLSSPSVWAGTVTSFLVGLFALIWLLKFVQAGKMHYFAPYVWIVGIATLISQSVG